MTIHRIIITISFSLILSLNLSLVWAKGAKAQFGNPHIINFAPYGSLWETDQGIYNAPNNIAFTNNGSLWIANQSNTVWLRINQAGELLERIVNSETSHLKRFPNEMLKADDGSIWQSDAKDPLVLQRIDKNGQVVAEARYADASLGGVTTIQRIQTAKNGSVWVLYNYVYHGTGYHELDWGYSGLKHCTADGTCTIGLPFGVSANYFAIAADGSLWVTNLIDLYPSPSSKEKFKHSISHFDTKGQLIEYIDLPNTSDENPLTLTGIAIAEDGALWVSDPSNHRILKFVSDYSASYDDKNHILILNDVDVGGIHYQATLKQQYDLFSLLTLEPAAKTYSPAASFNVFTRLLTLPLVRVLEQDYQAQFKYLGDSVFQLQSAIIKHPTQQ